MRFSTYQIFSQVVTISPSTASSMGLPESRADTLCVHVCVCMCVDMALCVHAHTRPSADVLLSASTHMHLHYRWKHRHIPAPPPNTHTQTHTHACINTRRVHGAVYTRGSHRQMVSWLFRMNLSRIFSSLRRWAKLDFFHSCTSITKRQGYCLPPILRSVWAPMHARHHSAPKRSRVLAHLRGHLGLGDDLLHLLVCKSKRDGSIQRGLIAGTAQLLHTFHIIADPTSRADMAGTWPSSCIVAGS